VKGIIIMPVYEYRCEKCEGQFEATQSVHARPEDTVCPHCHAQSATRIISACASTVRGERKPGFQEMKAYNMLNERMSKFSKLPPLGGKRDAPPLNMTMPPDASDAGGHAGGTSGSS
jgi:putative FmdB family regulatory protein